MSFNSLSSTRRELLAGAAAAGVATMLAGSSKAAESNVGSPFSVSYPQDQLDDLRRRVAATRWPDKETVADDTQGVQLATVQKLADYWAGDYDWRKMRGQAQRLAAVHHRDRRPGHPFHPRPLEARERAADHRHPWLARLDHRAAEDHRAADRSDRPWRQRGGCLPRRDPVAAGLRLLGQADRAGLEPDPHRQGLGDADAAPRLHEIRRPGRRLGQRRLRTDGACRSRPGLLGIHTNMAATVPADIAKALAAGGPPPAGLSPDEKRAWDQLDDFYKNGLGYAIEMNNRPQTLYGIVDSPVGLAAWMLDHDIRSYEMIARVFDGKAEGLTQRRHPRQRHALLADQHRDLLGAPLLGQRPFPVAAASSTRAASRSRSPSAPSPTRSTRRRRAGPRRPIRS